MDAAASVAAVVGKAAVKVDVEMRPVTNMGSI
jgi:hypothetical protein